MSINTIIDNPTILQELKDAISGGGSTPKELKILYNTAIQAPTTQGTTVNILGSTPLTNVKGNPLLFNGTIQFFNPQGSGYFSLNIEIYENGNLVQTLTGTITGGYGYTFLPINTVVIPSAPNGNWSISLSSSGTLSISSVNPFTTNTDPCFFTMCISQNQ